MEVIDNAAFYNTGISEIVIPNSVKKVGGNMSLTGISKVYCPEEIECYANNRSVFYSREGLYYRIGDKMYNNLKNMLKGIYMRRIYDVDDAMNIVSQKEGNNTFSIRYR